MNNEQPSQACRLQIQSFISLIYEQEPPNEDEKTKQDILKRDIYDFYSQDEKILNIFCEYFMAYSLKVKGVSMDEPSLAIYTIEELRQMIRLFKQNLKTIQAEHQKSKQQEKPKPATGSIIREDIPLPKAFYKNGAWDYELIHPAVQCNHEKHFFDSKSSKISIKFINHFFKRSNGFFGIGGELALWIQIQTTTLGKKKKVTRSVDDFFFLERTLHSIFPHSYIPPLRISKDDLKQSTEVGVKKMISRCFSFLSKIAKQEELLENFYTFRFLVEEKQSNYREHRIKYENLSVNGFDTFKNLKGKVSVNVSQYAQALKSEYMKKSQYIEKAWRNVGNIATFAVQSCKQLSQYLGNITDQLKFVKTTLQHNCGGKDSMKQSAAYIKLIGSFQNIINLFKQSLQGSSDFVLHLKNQFVDKTYMNWESFNEYKRTIEKNSSAYQQKRKQFLCNEAMKLMEPIKKDVKISKNDLNIKDLNLRENQAEEQWFLSQTPWYGYLNNEFLATFQGFIQRDKQRLQRQLLRVSHQIYKRNHQRQRQFSVIMDSIIVCA